MPRSEKDSSLRTNMHLKPLPENDTVEEESTKELAFRNLLLPHFEIRDVISDKNNGLRALTRALEPNIDSHAENDANYILRGNIVDYAMKHPELITEDLERYCYLMANGDQAIGLQELNMLSEILKNPIHIYRMDDARIDKGDRIYPNPSSIFGGQWGLVEPVSIYYNPVSQRFSSMKSLI